MPATSTGPSPPPPPASSSLFFDDDDFGDFEFAPPLPPHPITNLHDHHQQPPPVATKNNSRVAADEDDEWGDFIESNRTSSSPPPDPAITRPQAKVWEKPSGALPLSIFGEEEEDAEEPDLGSSTANGAKDSIFSSSEVTSAARNGTVSRLGGGGILDLLSDLYGRNEKEGDGRRDDEHDDFDESGWEFKDAESDFFGGEEAQIQVLANGVEHVQEQSMLSEACKTTHENGDASALSHLFLGVINPADFTSTTKHKSKGLNIGNSLNPNSTSSNVSIPPPTKDMFFYSSAPGKSETGLGLSGGGIKDLVTDLCSPGNKLGSHKECNGNYSNGVIPKLAATIYNDDDFNDNNWEFKDAITYTCNEHDVKVEVIEKSVENIHLPTEIVNDKKDDGDACHVHETDTKVPDLFFSAVSHADSFSTAYHGVEDIKIENGMKPNLAIPNASPSIKDVPFSSALPLKSSPLGAGSGNIRDLLDDLYGQANKLDLDNTASHNNGDNTDLGARCFINDDLDDSSWEFRDTLPDMHSGESNSLQDQKNYVESSMSAAINGNQEPHSILNSPIKCSADPYPTITGGNDSSAFRDLLFDGADQSTSVDFTQKPIHSTAGVFENLNYVNSEDKFWVSNRGIKTAPSENSVNDKSLDTSKVITNLAPEVLVDFYTKLKDMSHFLVLQHLDDLKKAHEVADLSGAEHKAVELHQEIQAALADLHDELEFSENISMEGLSKDVYIDNLLERLQKPYLQPLELVYFLSEKISLAKKHLTSAIHLFKHATLILWLMNAASWEDQRAYIVAWSKIISACTQELQHGAMIWTQCLQANVHKQILSEIQGCQYFLALGEIFRVTEILSVSSTIYKPWLLLNPVESDDFLINIRKCSKFWLSPGLEKALESIPDLADAEKKEKIKSLLESINFIRSLDTSDLQNDVPRHGDRVCQLSLLPLGKLQDMETVVWSGKRYFLKLANLWANRISSDSPSLPCINVG